MGRRVFRSGYKNLFHIGLLSILWVLLSAFTVPSYQPDQAIVDPLGYINNDDRVRVYEAYQDIRENTGVRIISILSNEVEAGGAGSAVAEVLGEWQLSRGVVVVINPENGEVGFGVTKDIQEQVKESGIVGDRLKSDVKSGNIVPGLLFFYEDFPLADIGMAQTSEVSDPNEIIDYTESDVGDTANVLTPSTLEVELGLVDWIMIGVVSVGLIGMLVYAFRVNKVNREIERDILVFVPYKIANEGQYTDKEIWNQLLEEGELEYAYSEYNKYLDSPRARRLSSTNDRFVADDFNRNDV